MAIYDEHAGDEIPNLVSDKKMLATILAGIGDAVCVYDAKCHILFQSANHRAIFGECLGKKCALASGCVNDIIQSQKPHRWIEKKVDEKKAEHFYEMSVFPIRDKDEKLFGCINIARDISQQIELEVKNRELEKIREEANSRFSFEKIVGKSQAMQKVFESVRAVAGLETTVLIQGETGTGKELVARAIHQRSLRRDKAFIAVNCGALTETLLESELFGHVKGSFTGAYSDKIGLFQEAKGGTIFLDEIAEISQPTQVKLLRVLQEGEIRRVGSTKDEKVDARVLAASNRDLKKLVDEKKFREDLFYRLNVFPIYIPPLRERQEDILLLADHFLKFFSQRNRKPIKAFTKSAQEILLRHPWPGNVRELANLIERALILAKKDSIGSEDLLIPTISAASAVTISKPDASKDNLKTVSRQKIIEVLQKNGGNKIKTARDLGISRSTLWRYLKEIQQENSNH